MMNNCFNRNKGDINKLIYFGRENFGQRMEEVEKLTQEDKAEEEKQTDVVNEERVQQTLDSLYKKAEDSSLSDKYKKTITDKLDSKRGVWEAMLDRIDKTGEAKLKKLGEKIQKELDAFNQSDGVKEIFEVIEPFFTNKDKIKPAINYNSYAKRMGYWKNINEELAKTGISQKAIESAAETAGKKVDELTQEEIASATMKTISDIQRVLGIKVDGKAGPETINAIAEMLGFEDIKVLFSKETKKITARDGAVVADENAPGVGDSVELTKTPDQIAFDEYKEKLITLRDEDKFKEAIDLSKEFLKKWGGQLETINKLAVLNEMNSDLLSEAEIAKAQEEFTFFGKPLRTGDIVAITRAKDYIGWEASENTWKLNEIDVKKGIRFNDEWILHADVESHFRYLLNTAKAKDPTLTLIVKPRLVKPTLASDLYLQQYQENMKSSAALSMQEEIKAINAEVKFGEEAMNLPLTAPFIKEGAITINNGNISFSSQFDSYSADRRLATVKELKKYIEEKRLREKVERTQGLLKISLEAEQAIRGNDIALGRTKSLEFLEMFNKDEANKSNPELVEAEKQVRGYLKGIFAQAIKRLASVNQQMFSQASIEKVKIKKHYGFASGQMRKYEAAFRFIRSKNENALKAIDIEKSYTLDPEAVFSETLKGDTSKPGEEISSAVSDCAEIWGKVVMAEMLFIRGSSKQDSSKVLAEAARALMSIGEYDEAVQYARQGLKSHIDTGKELAMVRSLKENILLKMRNTEKAKYKQIVLKRFYEDPTIKAGTEIPEAELDILVEKSMERVADEASENKIFQSLVASRDEGILAGHEAELVDIIEKIKNPNEKLTVITEQEWDEMGDTVIKYTLHILGEAALIGVSGGTGAVAGAAVRTFLLKKGVSQVTSKVASTIAMGTVFEATNKALAPAITGGQGFTTYGQFVEDLGPTILMFGGIEAGKFLSGVVKAGRAKRLADVGKGMSEAETAGHYILDLATEAGIMTDLAIMQEMAAGGSYLDTESLRTMNQNIKMIIELRLGGKLVKPITEPLNQKAKQITDRSAEAAKVEASEPATEKVEAKAKTAESPAEFAEPVVEATPVAKRPAENTQLRAQGEIVKPRSSGEIIAEARGKTKQPELTERIINDGAFTVERSVAIGGKTFHVGPISEYRDRLYSIMMVDRGDGTLLARAIYKSKSKGSWRVAPYFAVMGERGDGTIVEQASKGNTGGYTNETLLDSRIANALDSIAQKGVKQHKGNRNPLGEYFEISSEAITEYGAEVREAPESELLKDFRQKGYLPGKITETNAEAYFRSLDSKYPEGFIPDFSRGPTKQVFRNHEMFGPIIIETYTGKLNGKTVEWDIAYEQPNNPTSQGRVWIENIGIRPKNINSYGVESDVLLGGVLLHKPADYRSQIRGIAGSGLVSDIPGHTKYGDISKLLDNLRPIREFRNARNIHRRTSAEAASNN